MKNFRLIMLYRLLLLVILLLTPAFAQEEEEGEPAPPPPDLWAASIETPDGLLCGPTNKVKVVVENKAEESSLEGKVKVELVVIQSGDRMSYFTEVEGMRFQEKREALFEGVEVKNKESVRLLVIVDPEKLVSESDEENNRRIMTAWVQEPAPPAPEEDEQPEEN